MGERKSITVELRYDPVRPETYIAIDGSAVDGGDIYGFLYPVRRCVLQAWLYESGSWPGLCYQLEELARGEALKLVFFGRECDYRDVSDSLRGCGGLELSFKPWTRDDEYRSALERASKQLRALLEERVSLDMSYYGMDATPSRSLSDLFPESAARIQALLKKADSPEDVWLSWAETPEQLHALRSGGGCVAVREGAIGSFEGLGALRMLTGSMQRSPEMIVCVLDTPEKRDEYRAYASQFPGRQPLFVCAEDDHYLDALRDKYANAFLLRCGIEAIRAACEEVDLIRVEEAELERRRVELESRRLSKSGEADELNRCRMALRWLKQRRMTIGKLMNTAEDPLISLEGGMAHG